MTFQYGGFPIELHSRLQTVPGMFRWVGSIARPPKRFDVRRLFPILGTSSFITLSTIPADHPSASAPSITLAALAGEAWILFPENEGPGLYSTITRACGEAGFSPKVTQRAVQMETIIGLVAAGLGVSLVPEAFLSTKRDGVVFRRLDGMGTPVPYRLGLAWCNDQSLPVLSSFLRFMDQLKQVDPSAASATPPLL